MRIGLFGGTFDPIHNAHIDIARCAKKQYDLDKVIIMPCGNPPHKNTITDKKIRFRMTEIAIGDEFDVCDYEVLKEEYSYTLVTLMHFKELYPDDEIFLIIGEDSLKDIEKWYKPKEIVARCSLLVFPRVSVDTLTEHILRISSLFGAKIYPIDSPIIPISSTDIRKMIRNDENVELIVPAEVVRFIKENDVY